MRMAQTHQYIMSVLINQLMEQGDLARAKRVADKWQRELPHENVPYTEDALAMAECYYKVHEVEKADAIVKDLLERAAEWLCWQNALDARRVRDPQRHNTWLRTMQHALLTAYDNERYQLVEPYIRIYENFTQPIREKQGDASVILPQ